MEQTINTTAANETTAAASFFASVLTYITSIGLVKIIIALFIQLVMVLSTVLGISMLASQIILFVGVGLITVGACWCMVKMFKLFMSLYGMISVWVLSLSDRFSKKGKKAAPAVAPVVAPAAAADDAEAQAA